MVRWHSVARHDLPGVRARVLDAASDILASQGIAKLSLRLIAEQADIGLTSIYYYFPSKEALVLSLAISGHEEVRKAMIEVAAQAEGEERFRVVARAYLSYSQLKPSVYELMHDEGLMSRHETLREAENATLLTFREVVREDPRFPSEKADGIAFALFALGRGLSAIGLSQPGKTVTPEQQALFSMGVGYLIWRT